jgi:hypothetical protein
MHTNIYVMHFDPLHTPVASPFSLPLQ